MIPLIAKFDKVIVRFVLILIVFSGSACSVTQSVAPPVNVTELEISEFAKFGRIEVANATVRSKPSVDAAELRRLTRNTIVYVLQSDCSTLSENNHWLQIETGLIVSPIRGWIAADFVECIDEGMVARVDVDAATSLNVRAGPGTDAAKVESVFSGDPLIVTGQINNCIWLQVITPTGINGWAAAQYLVLNTACNLVPAVPIPPTPLPSLILLNTLTPSVTLEAIEYPTEPPTTQLPTSEPSANDTPEPPTVEPPTVEPPTVEPPTVEPPTVEPPTVEPPTVEPPTVEPPKRPPLGVISSESE